MTCACESEYAFPCQFGPEEKLFPFDNREWCRFHLPLRDAAGKLSDKGSGYNGWEEGGPELVKFTDEVHARLRAARPSWTDLLNLDDEDNFWNEGDDNRADFRGIAFPSGFSFGGLAEVLYVNFNQASFGYRVRFDHVTFSRMASFRGTIFDDRASFRGAKFRYWVYFDDSIFGDDIRFDSAAFGPWASFYGATFHGGSNFYGATFGGLTNFHVANFGGDAMFGNVTFSNTASFAKVKFQGSADFSAGTKGEAKFDFKDIDFANATFTGACTFDNRSFGTGTNFNGATFKDLAAFHGCEFHPGMSFHQTKFLKTKEDKLNTKKDNDDATERLERSYRTLKLEMEKLRARNEEADFFALEMECRRQRGSVPRFERFAATLYKHLSDYGRSVDLPLIWLLVLAYAAHYLYLGVALIDCNPGPGARLAFTLEQMFRPFFVWAKSAPGTGNCLVENSPLLIPFLASLQSLTAIGLLTLFLLALRRRFKMD